MTLVTGFNHALGVSFDEIGPDRVILSIEISDVHLQPFGIVHGGVWCALVETAASVGAATWYGREKGRVVGVSNQTDFFRPAKGGRAIATATPIQRGRLQQVWMVEILEETGVLFARGQLRLQNLPAEELRSRAKEE